MSPLVVQVARPSGRAHVHRRQVRRDGRLDSGGLPRRGVPEVRGPLLLQRAGQGAQVEEAQGRCHAQGHTRHGVTGGIQGQGACRGFGARRHEAEGSRWGRQGRLCRGPDLRKVPCRPLEEDQVQQRHRADHPKDPAQDEDRWDVP